MLNIVLFGPPGSGKGTQSENLIEKYGLIHISTGDLFRYNMGNDTELGVLAKSYINKGQLVPDEVTIKMLEDKVNQYDLPKGFIFDGFPRTTAQAEALDTFLASKEANVSVMLSLKVQEEELMRRLLERGKTSGREDDTNPEIIKNRIAVYEEETAVVEDFYAGQGKCKVINGEGPIELISDALFDAIDSL